MHIPLDYYRILGLPIQATADQLQQAHRDRSLQLPRREYSELAINGRKQLIDEAYAVLNDSAQRQQYDQRFLLTAAPLDALTNGDTPPPPAEVTPAAGEAALRSLALDDPPPVTAAPPLSTTIEAEDHQFVGALLILLELGEYEQVIQLGRPYLSSGHRSLADGRLGDPQLALADIVLSLVLACLELGREQWQQRRYETAAESLSTGSELLLGENLFPAIRAEIQAELYKLRPYRILELLARPQEQTRERRQGMTLLRSMLEDRGGIEGTEDDLSGLPTDDFLRFVQQLRDYLTAAEQQELFEQEARRPSPVATYLTVYALLARGFARQQPALVRRAKQLLLHLSQQQDVHLEQAVCALLLGQTEEASRALELSQEYEPLAFIRDHSRNAPDLLPGLCLYSERWLREEVFPHFRDFRNQEATLKDYFANDQVQAYLEAMPPTPSPTPELETMPTVQGSMPLNASAPVPSAPLTPTSVPRSSATHLEGDSAAIPPTDAPLAVAERVSQLSPEGRMTPPTSPAPRRDHRPERGSERRPIPGAEQALTSAPSSPQRSSSLRLDRVALLIGLALLGIGTVSFLTSRTVRWATGQMQGPRLSSTPVAVSLTAPPIEIPAPPTASEQIGVNDIAQRTIERWLEAKREALGPEYRADALAQVLVEPALTQWQRRAAAAVRENWHWEYDHAVAVESVEPNDPTADALTVRAEVSEAGRLFEFEVQNTAASYNDRLVMEYDLIRQDGDWYVQNSTKLGEAGP